MMREVRICGRSINIDGQMKVSASESMKQAFIKGIPWMLLCAVWERTLA